MVGMVFALGAYLRRSKWEECSLATAIAAIAVAIPLTGGSLFFTACAFGIFVGYYILLNNIANRERQNRP
jgi:hypothetical protein